MQIDNWIPLQDNERVLIFDVNKMDNLPHEPLVRRHDDVTNLVFQPPTLQTGSSVFSILRGTVVSNSSDPVSDLVFQWKLNSTSNLIFEWFVETATVKIESVFPSIADVSVSWNLDDALFPKDQCIHC